MVFQTFISWLKEMSNLSPTLIDLQKALVIQGRISIKLCDIVRTRNPKLFNLYVDGEVENLATHHDSDLHLITVRAHLERLIKL